MLEAETEGPGFQESHRTEQKMARGPEFRLTYPSLDYLSALYTLEYVQGFGPDKFKALHEAGIDPCAVVEDPE